MNPVLILTRNCLSLTKKCVASVLAQDIETEIVLLDNGSTDGTVRWAHSELPKNSPIIQIPDNLGVSYGWNRGLQYLFDKGAKHVFVVNNDTVLPLWFCRYLLSYTMPSFVTGVSVDSMDQIADPPGPTELVPHPDFSAFCIKRECWELVGPFDEAMVHYAGDTDYHLRAHRAGVTLWNAQIPFYHERSSTLKNASPRDRREIELQADADREVFYAKWKCFPGDRAYQELFK